MVVSGEGLFLMSEVTLLRKPADKRRTTRSLPPSLTTLRIRPDRFLVSEVPLYGKVLGRRGFL